MQFIDRADAGVELSKDLDKYVDDKSIVIALPRGGVRIGYEVSEKLKLPLFVLVVRKLGSPDNPELGIGAIAENDTFILDRCIIDYLGITSNQIDKVLESEKNELNRRIKQYRSGKPLPNTSGKTIILVDDGLATGVTARAAIKALKKNKPEKIIFAAPVCAHETVKRIRVEVDHIICLIKPNKMRSINFYYQDFSEVTDAEVNAMLKKT